MNLLPEIIKIIFSFLPISDKRNFLRTCKTYHQLHILMKKYENEFRKMINEIDYLGTKIKTLEGIEKYTLEIIYDGYANLLPKRYIIKENKILYEYGRIYYNSAVKNFKAIIEILLRCNKRYENFIIFGAAYEGNIELLEWVHENGCRSNYLIYHYAIDNGQLETIKWAHKKGYIWGNFICARAAKGGYLEIIKWLRENGCKWDHYTCQRAAKYGHLEVLKWVRENGCKWDDYTCAAAAQNGNLEILKWLRENGCPWDNETYERAVKNGNIDILKWLRENGCPEELYLMINHGT
jgi:hypothetical protein